MNVRTLRDICDVMIRCGHSEAVVCINDSRDGVKSFPRAVAMPEKITEGHVHAEVVLAVSYE